MMLITVIVLCENLEQMNDNVDQLLIIGVLSKLLPFFVNDKGEKSYAFLFGHALKDDFCRGNMLSSSSSVWQAVGRR